MEKVYEVYQWSLTEMERARINARGWEAAPKHYCDTKFGEVAPEAVREAFADGHYVHVANVHANDLEEVFEIGNGYGHGPGSMPANLLEILTDKMYSVSVGDLIYAVLEGKWHLVANYGFTEVGYGAEEKFRLEILA